MEQAKGRFSMKKMQMLSSLLLAAAFALLAGSARAQVKQLLNAKELGRAVPTQFYLEGNAIPTEKRNAALVSTPDSPRVLFALIDTTGYSSQIQQKYIGMIITEGQLDACGHELGVGSYGFGLDKPPGPTADAQFHVYDQAGNQLFACAAPRDSKLAQPRPLEVAVGDSRLYLGRYWISIK